MILVLAGTQDGRELARRIADEGYDTAISVVSGYGKKLVEGDRLLINDRPLKPDALCAFIREHKIKALIDATHPYAASISRSAMSAADDTKILYVRYERETVELSVSEHLYIAADAAEAARRAAALGSRIFLTTGSKTLGQFVGSPETQKCTLIARVLPTSEVVAECAALGFTPKTLVAMQGPFSHELNLALFKKYRADVIVTKNSGLVGGTDTKISAALELGLPVVVIDRPSIPYRNQMTDYEQVIEFLHRTVGKS